MRLGPALVACLGGLTAAGCLNDALHVHPPTLDDRDPESLCAPFGAQRCTGRTLETCSSGGTWTSLMECPLVCEQGQCQGDCRPGARQCQGQDVLICDDHGHWQVQQTCPSACLPGGTCGGVCSPGAAQCVDAHLLATCTVQGTWATTTCAGQACVGSACTGECTPGSFKCGNGPQTRQVCSDAGAWEITAPCPFLCAGDGGQCGGVCRPGDRRCDADHRTQETCDGNGAWLASTCPLACVDKDCAGVCVPGSKRCAPSGAAEVQTCDDRGQWLSAICPFVCSAAACGGQCVPGDHRCLDAATLSTCSPDGQWQSSSCGMQACVSGQCTGSCHPGDDMCMTGDVYRCQDNGTLALQESCPFPGTICAPAPAAACGPNLTLVYGNDVAPSSAGTIVGNVLYLTRVQIGPTPVDVRSVGLRALGAANTAVKTAVYKSDANGVPSDRLMFGSGLATGDRSLIPDAPCVILPANAVVWVGVVFPQNQTLSWGYVTGPGQVLRRKSQEFTAPMLPDPFDPGTNPIITAGSGLPVFIEAQERYDCQ